MENRTDLELYEDAQKFLGTSLNLLEFLIVGYGSVSVREETDLTRDNILHDYVYFCISKATRSMIAANILQTEGMNEDVKIITRAAYECYLNGMYACNVLEDLDKLVRAKIGVYMGHYEHPLSKKGKMQWNKIIDPETGKEFEYTLSISHMSQNTGVKLDGDVHKQLYSFLSEFVHVHMIAAGSYRDPCNTNYRPINNYKGLFTITIQVYVTVLILDLLDRHTEVDEEDLDHFLRVKNYGARLVEELCSCMDFADNIKDLKIQLVERMKSNI
ncbi:carboxylesterase family protein [Vibrio harveyi]|nr:carboxylesterase family protein [Vibrio harveyi]